MCEEPRHWSKHYHGSAHELAYARKYSYSDRSRYYWPNPKVHKALDRLLENLTDHSLPATLLSQYLPNQYRAVRDGRIQDSPIDLILHRIMEVTGDYACACGAGPSVSKAQ